MPQQLPSLRRGQHAPSSPPPFSLNSSSDGERTSASSGTTKCITVSPSIIASAQRALHPPRGGCAVVVSPPRPVQRLGTKASTSRVGSRTALASKGMVPTSTNSVGTTDTLFSSSDASLAQRDASAPATAALEHLEYVASAPSLERQSYLPHAHSSDGGDKTVTQTDMLALRDATTSLFIQHIGLDCLRDASKVENDPNGGSVGTNEQDHGDEEEDVEVDRSITPIGITSALLNTMPVMSAALREVGVDDRVNPLILDKLIHESRRRARAAAAAKHDSLWRGLLPHRLQKYIHPRSAGEAARQGSGTQTGRAADASTELRFHELPAIKSASEACCTATPEKANTRGGASSTAMSRSVGKELGTSGAKQMADFIENFTKELNEEESAGNAPFAATPGIYSTEKTHIAAAVSSSDSAFVRQLVKYYCARAATAPPASHATRATTVVEAPTQANLRSHQARMGQDGNAGFNTSEGGCMTPSFSFTCPTPAFSLLDAVMHVSREFVVQHSASGVQDQSTGMLSEQRRFLLNRLTNLEQTRIPQTWWITSLPYLGRLSPTKKNKSNIATTPVRMSAFATSTEVDSANLRESSSFRRAARSEKIATPQSMDGCGSESSAGADKEAELHPRDSMQKASMLLTGPGDNPAIGGCAQLVFGAGTTRNTIFPAQHPVERSQVYLLAEVLDRMLRDPNHPRWLALLANPQVARYVLDDGDDTDDAGQHGGPRQGTLVHDLWDTPGEQRLAAYTDAATHVLDILDTGLAELGRQVASSCVERGALLDLLRQSIMDIASSHVHVLNQVKRQAHIDALEAQTLRKEKAQLQKKLKETEKALDELQKTHTALCARVEPLQFKGDRLDELMARAAAKARRFETSRHDQHTAILQMLMESMTNSAGNALDGLLTEVQSLQLRRSDLGEESTAAESTKDSTTPSAALPTVEMPSVAAARSQSSEQRETMERLYNESHRLLRGLQDAVTATNTLCEPLYASMVLKDVSPAAKVATSRWTSVARSVGAFEREKRHRQRVYDVFMEYCTNYRHKSAVKGNTEVVSSDTIPRDQSYGEAFLVSERMSPGSNIGNSSTGSVMEYGEPSALSVITRETNYDSGTQDELNSTMRETADIDLERASSSVLAMQEEMHNGPAKGCNIVTLADLRAMNATDCTVDEVNALFRKDFDLHKYLRGSWEQYLLESKELDQAFNTPGTAANISAGTHSAGERTYTLNLSDVLQMLSDVQATLAEITVRITAMSQSALVRAGLHPPLEPPSHPEQRCPLCNRRDTCELERQRRREAMSRIARDLQTKMDAVEDKCRVALTERDKALGEVRRLKMELQHSFGIGGDEHQQTQEMRAGGFPHDAQHLLSSPPTRKLTSDSTTTELPTQAGSGENPESLAISTNSNLTVTASATKTSEMAFEGMLKISNQLKGAADTARVSFPSTLYPQDGDENFLAEAADDGSFNSARFEGKGIPSRRRVTAVMASTRSTRRSSSESTGSHRSNSGTMVHPGNRRDSDVSLPSIVRREDSSSASLDTPIGRRMHGASSGRQARGKEAFNRKKPSNSSSDSASDPKRS